MKRAVYNVLFALVFPFLLPGFLVRMFRRGGYRARMLDRFAIYPKGLFAAGNDSGGFVWIHAVSVGEVQVAGQLMREWRRLEPDVRFCFSTTSSTGWRTAERELAQGDVLVYNPLDFPNFVKSALAAVRPRAVVLTESEIWPNFIWQAKKRGIPVFLVNARVSDRSAPRYKKGKFFFADVFGSFSRIYAQSELDKARLVAAGTPEEIVSVEGSFKFDVARRNPEKENELAQWIGSLERGGERRKLLVGGSTWPGEDEILLSIVSHLDNTVLAIAPRHFEKADKVEENIVKAGFRCIRRSRGDKPAGVEGEVFLADTTGELMGLYGIADAVFVGKSLCEHGSQNMIEPCLCGKPVVIGPYTENFRPVMSDLLEARAVLQVEDAQGLERALRRILMETDDGLGNRAAKAVSKRQGVVPRCAADIVRRTPSVAPSCPAHGGGSVLAAMAGTLLVCAALAVLLFFANCFSKALPASGRTASAAQKETKTLPKLKAVRSISAYVSYVENPAAAGVLLADGEAAKYKEAFEATCLETVAEKDACGGEPFDIVFAAGGVSTARLETLLQRTSDDGVLALAVSVDKMSAGEFKEILESFPCESVHLWMPSARDWLLVGRKTARKIGMSAIMDLFSNPGFTVIDAEECGAGSIQEIFASYVGTREDVMPAFALGDLGQEIRPEFLVQGETPDIAWVDPDGVDDDIVSDIADAIVKFQDNRRSIIKADMKFRNEGLVDDAIEMWAGAMKTNPHDTMLLDRLYIMAVNARAFHDVGNFRYAAQCYEAMVSINPSDIPVVEEYAKTLRAIGKSSMADSIMNRVREMRRNLP